MPVNDDKASSLLIGLRLETTKEHIVRSIIEALSFKFAMLYETVLNETKTPLSSLIKFVHTLLSISVRCQTAFNLFCLQKCKQNVLLVLIFRK